MTNPNMIPILHQLSLDWIKERDYLSARLNSGLISAEGAKERQFMKDFVEAHNALAGKLIAVMGITDSKVMGAFAELTANAASIMGKDTLPK